MPGYQWVKAAHNYRDVDTGRFLGRDFVREVINQELRDTSNRVSFLAGDAVNGHLSPDDWLRMMRAEIKREYVDQYMVGRGGREAMTFRDWGRTGAMIKEQYRYANGFAHDLAGGNLTEAQAVARAQMYVRSAREAYEKAHAVALGESADEVIWILDGGEHCSDCLAFAAMGWQKIADDPFDGAMPGSGDTSCLTNCLCSLDYRSSSEAEQGERGGVSA